MVCLCSNISIVNRPSYSVKMQIKNCMVSLSSSKLDTDTNFLFLLAASHTFRSIAITIQVKSRSEKLGPAIIGKLEKLNRKLQSFPWFSGKIVKIGGEFRKSIAYLLFGSSRFGTETSKSGGHVLSVLTIKTNETPVSLIAN